MAALEKAAKGLERRIKAGGSIINKALLYVYCTSTPDLSLSKPLAALSRASIVIKNC